MSGLFKLSWQVAAGKWKRASWPGVLAAAGLIAALVHAPADANQSQPGAGASSTNAATARTSGTAIFSDQCATCHGAKGEGTAIAPSLQSVTNLALVKQMIREGKGIMPSFTNELSSAQMDAAAEYVVTKITQGTAAAAPPPPKKPETAVTPSSEGARLFAQHCAVCHGPEGKGTATAPGLEAAADLSLVEQRIREGKGVMPSFTNQLSAAQIKKTADYVVKKLATLRLTGGNLSEGGVVYRLNCSPCHRTAVRGGALIFTKGIAPPLLGLSPATIAGAVRAGPGAMPRFPTAVLDDHQLASIVKYVQFMQKPPHPGGFPMHFYGPVAEGLAAFIVLVVLALIGVWIERKGAG